MQLNLKITGGFTGAAGAEHYALDLADGPPSQTLRELLASADFFTLPATLHNPQPKPWDFLYELSVADGLRQHSVSFHLDAAPAALRLLCEKLKALAQAPRG
ncbi:protealysin inhibitor emfourin [Methylovulum psychrotolerans]|uniref:Uncharacterized protein n=1 Tax=Methylovulum psychrotolerans TaxID=1704499 RepID=A0A1Z4C4C2_9GAMM|nr:protealysin inhibitor emfourin [Methylovulum psychrotolerans]ASF48392.1 hypothetical protein CEK71_21305 [Methylovulum psychrotolerans]